jgi:8-oxo-dGTP diphosphatase
MITQVAAAIIEKGQMVLIGKRAAHKDFAGYWELPGGKIEPGETDENCIERELYEELKIKVTIRGFIAEQYHDYGNVKILLKVYLCNLIEGEFILTDHDDVRWVPKDKLLSFDLVPADISIIQKYINKNII